MIIKQVTACNTQEHIDYVLQNYYQFSSLLYVLHILWTMPQEQMTLPCKLTMGMLRCILASGDNMMSTMMPKPPIVVLLPTLLSTKQLTNSKFLLLYTEKEAFMS